MNSIIKIWNKRWMLRSLFSTIYFNFHYLPFNQAIRLPILLYKPHLVKCKGSVNISKEGGGIWHDSLGAAYCQNLSKQRICVGK